MSVYIYIGAVVKLQCNNTKQPREWYGKTDKNGYFLIKVEKKLSSFGAHTCKLYLVSSPSPACKKPTDLLHGEQGALLRWPHKPSKFPFELFTVGPFAFEPYNKCLWCFLAWLLEYCVTLFTGGSVWVIYFHLFVCYEVLMLAPFFINFWYSFFLFFFSYIFWGIFLFYVLDKLFVSNVRSLKSNKNYIQKQKKFILTNKKYQTVGIYVCRLLCTF